MLIADSECTVTQISLGQGISYTHNGANCSPYNRLSLVHHLLESRMESY